MKKKELKGRHQTTDPLAVPIEITKAQFEINHGNHKYTRTQFPVILAYAVTAHKSQGATLSEVIVDFTPDRVDGKINKPYIIEGSFYVAITRCKLSENVYLADFDPSYIKIKKEIASKIDDMRQLRPYIFKKIFNEDQIFENQEYEIN